MSSHKGPRILLDAEVLVRLAYLTITGNTDFEDLETLRLTYERGGQASSDEANLESSLELTPMEELRKFFEEALRSSEGFTE